MKGGRAPKLQVQLNRRQGSLYVPKHCCIDPVHSYLRSIPVSMHVYGKMLCLPEAGVVDSGREGGMQKGGGVQRGIEGVCICPYAVLPINRVCLCVCSVGRYRKEYAAKKTVKLYLLRTYPYIGDRCIC